MNFGNLFGRTRRDRFLTIGYAQGGKVLYGATDVDRAEAKGTLLDRARVSVPYDSDDYVVQSIDGKYEIVGQDEATGRIVAYFLGYPPRFAR